jgi:replicative DNA helicase
VKEIYQIGTLGKCLTSADYLREAMRLVDPEWFDDWRRDVFTAIGNLYEIGSPIEPLTVAYEMIRLRTYHHDTPQNILLCVELAGGNPDA